MKVKKPKGRNGRLVVNPAYPQRTWAARKAARKTQGLERAIAKARAAPVGADERPKAVRVEPHQLHRLGTKELASLGMSRAYGDQGPIMMTRSLGPPKLFPGVVPRRVPKALPGENEHFALDSSSVAPMYAWANQYCSQIGFPGYPFLSQLALRSEYRAPAETTAKEMTRRWLKFKSASAGDKSAKITQLEELWLAMKIRDKIRDGVYNDMIFGRYQLFIDIKGEQTDIARQRPINFEAGLGKGCFLGIQGIEPIWTTPYSYNSIDPTRSDFYKPNSWFVLGRKTHTTRLLDIVSRPVPDLFKPAYNFGGISMSQLMEPYVVQWYRARDSVSDIMYSFSTSGIATNLSAYLEEDDGGEDRRAELFNKLRGNRGLLLIDKDTEEFFQYNVPLGSLDKLMAQFQEHMAAPSHTPLVKLLGVTPSGLNASSEGEIKVYYDWTHSEQEAVLDTIMTILSIVSQWHLFGGVDPDIVFEWVHMDEPTQAELATIRKSDADAGAQYIANGVITNAEERQRLQSDPESGYNNLKGGPPAMTPEQETQASQQEHEGEQADKDREHGAEQSDKDREHGAEQSDADRKLAEKTAKAKAAKPAAKNK